MSQENHKNRETTIATLYSEALPEIPQSNRCQIVVIEGPDMGRAVPIEEKEILIGTETDCDLHLTDERISRHHLSIQKLEGRFIIRDLDSRNGTLYEGSLVKSVTVSAGASIKVGRSFLRIQPTPEALHIPPSQARRFGDLVGQSLVMREVFAILTLASTSEATVLLEGETGTGKELAARAIHEASPRRRGPFVALDCGALPESMLESELFGHIRGAFTGASQTRVGAFARANKGTLFLDELGTVSLSVQARLLRAIEERQIRPVGADKEKDVDVRILAASRQNLETRVAEGHIRPDLFYRLSVIKLTLPPLRERREDIPLLITELLRCCGIEIEKASGSSLQRLMAHAWPGNVRELRNVIDRAIALSPNATSFQDLHLSTAQVPLEERLSIRTDLPFTQAKQKVVEVFERRYLQDVFERCQKNISATARISGVDRKHLKTLLRRYNLLESTTDTK